MIAEAWRWPNDALGRLAGGIVSGARRRTVDGAEIHEDPAYDRLFRLVPRHPRAMTFGSTVIAREPLDVAAVTHECTHVSQYRRYGPLYLPLYLLGAAWGVARHRDMYLGNPFEAQAMRAAAGVLSERPSRSGLGTDG